MKHEGAGVLNCQSLLAEQSLLWVCWPVCGSWTFHKCNALLIFISFQIKPLWWSLSSLVAFSPSPEELCASFIFLLSEFLNKLPSWMMFPTSKQFKRRKVPFDVFYKIPLLMHKYLPKFRGLRRWHLHSIPAKIHYEILTFLVLPDTTASTIVQKPPGMCPSGFAKWEGILGERIEKPHSYTQLRLHWPLFTKFIDAVIISTVKDEKCCCSPVPANLLFIFLVGVFVCV